MKGLFVRIAPYALAFFGSMSIMVLELVASRLVGRHVGMSLSVWTCVIGVMLGGICLGNVLGGRLADRADPRQVLGPIYALGAALTIATLWMNALMGLIPAPGADAPLYLWNVRTIAIVTLDFLLPSTILGMISPIVAKIAVEQSTRSGSAIGDVYTCGAVGSIVGTFVAGFYLIYLAPTSVIVTFVGAALALLASAISRPPGARAAALLASATLFVGGCLDASSFEMPGIAIGPIPVNVVTVAGHALALAMTLIGLANLRGLIRQGEVAAADDEHGGAMPSLRDLAILSFLASLGFMALEMVAGRLVQRHLGSSVYNWTSVIGVLLGGLSLGNFLGGKIADGVKTEKAASWLFLLGSMLTLSILLLERFDLLEALAEAAKKGTFKEFKISPDNGHAILSDAISMSGYAWWFRVLFKTFSVFFLPSVALGTVSPVVAKLAVERLRRSKRTGTAIGQVYAWGMVGSLLGTFLTGFLLIDLLGTKGVILAISTMLALSATVLGGFVHAGWAGVAIGLALMAFVPMPIFPKAPWNVLVKEVASEPGISDTGIAYVDETNYYFVKVENDPFVPRRPEADSPGVDDAGQPLRKRTLVLDNLIHGYFLLGHPEHIEYDYEFIYAQVAHRVAMAKGKAAGLPAGEVPPINTMFLGGGAYTFPRYLQHKYPGTTADVAEIDPGVTRANRVATGFLPAKPDPFEKLERTAAGQPFLKVEGFQMRLGPSNWPTPPTEAELKEKPELAAEYEEAREAAEQQAKAAHSDLERSTFPTIQTTFGDARQFVERRQGSGKYDLIFGDAFNDFSVPWHLTTKEFNEKLATLMAPDAVYMINIIDVYRSDRKAVAQGLADAEYSAVSDALKKAKVDPEKADALGRKLVNALDDARQGVATWPIARAVAEAIADLPGIEAPDRATVKTAIQGVSELMRGNREEMEETLRAALQPMEDRLPASIDTLVKATLDREFAFAQDQANLVEIAAAGVAKARRLGGFLSTWVETARLTFPHVYVFGTDDPPGSGLRETFVVAVSRQPLDLEEMGSRPGEPQFYLKGGRLFECRPYGPADEKALRIRSRGIKLTDDYAPVENLLAPVAETRGDN
ncbi:MAG: fused MFS/spermidine synthase [Isosphaeraceae bacterium]